MGWTTPQSVSTGTAASSTVQNTQVIDNLAWLGIDAPYCRVYRNSDQAISNTTSTVILFGQERVDNAELHSVLTNTSRITVPTGAGGWWSFSTSIVFAANATGFRRVEFLLNGSTVIARQNSVSTGGTEPTAIALTTEYRLVAGDYVEVQVYQNSGGSLNVVTASAYSPEFSGYWIRN